MRQLSFRIVQAVPTLAALLTCACSAEPDQITSCEARLLPTLKAPSTYRKIRSTVAAVGKNGQQDVFIEYDAANEYNAPLRATFWCVYDPKTKHAAQHNDSNLEPENLENIKDTTDAQEPKPSSPASAPEPASGARSVSRAQPDEVPVCDQPDSPEKFALMNELGIGCTGE
jgi:hypothetical protein